MIYLLITALLLLFAIYLAYLRVKSVKLGFQTGFVITFVSLGTVALCLGLHIGIVLGQHGLLKHKMSTYSMEITMKKTRDSRGLRIVRPDTTYKLNWTYNKLYVPLASPNAYVLDSDTLWTTATFEYKQRQ